MKVWSQVRVRSKSKAAQLGIALFALAVLLAIAWVFISLRGPRQTLLDVTLEQLEEQVRQAPQDPDARLAVAIAYAARGYHDNAIGQFQEVLKLEPDNQTALIGMGRSYLQQDMREKAMEPYLRVVELNKENPVRGTLEQLEAVYYDLGGIYVERREYSVAADYLRQALEINSVDADAWYVLGQAQKAAGEPLEALDAFQKAVRLAPDFREAYESMASVYKELGLVGERKYATGMLHWTAKSMDKALRDLQEATTAVPQMAEAHQGLGLVLEAQGRGQQALSSYQQALELDPTLLVARLAIERLAGAR
ncbi:MAG: tetratricopeptide repeat protein [Chloroflexi bacterium]|nr:tetratricopeptide repeat protein [Chloroflexota bacterium]